jgi:hypothetical protein
MVKEPTVPHDYRAFLQSIPGLTVVGGQAVNLWAITYCDPSKDDLPRFGSYDLDVIAKGDVATAIKNLPNWDYKKTPLWRFGDVRSAALFSTADDGRPLAVEILNSVKGLDKEDLAATRVIENDGVRIQVLDPIAMLKSKTANLRELKQDSDPPRQDREHLQIVAICFPRFLQDAHDQVKESVERHDEFSAVVSRAFRTLSEKRTAATLRRHGIKPSQLMPDLKDSPIEKVRTAYQHQLPRLKTLDEGVA